MKKRNDILEDIQKITVESGGGFIRQKDLEAMKISELLNLIENKNSIQASKFWSACRSNLRASAIIGKPPKFDINYY